MGLGPPILALYRQLKLLEALDGIDSVVELSSQGVWCPDRRLLTGLFQAFGRPVPTPGSVIGISFSASTDPPERDDREAVVALVIGACEPETRLAATRLLCRHPTQRAEHFVLGRPRPKMRRKVHVSNEL